MSFIPFLLPKLIIISMDYSDKQTKKKYFFFRKHKGQLASGYKQKVCSKSRKKIAKE